MDLLIRTINYTASPSLQKVVIVGHSSGGQFVQRWSLMTPYWNNSLFQGIVANPSSYAYLTPMRWIEGTWHFSDKQEQCPGYNDWPHGLDLGGNYTVSYVAAVVKALGIDILQKRFQGRDMVYLAGSLDACNVTGRDVGWCNSHGLETTCADMMQGRMRLERHQHYIQSLILLGIPYRRAIVPGVVTIIVSCSIAKKVFGQFLNLVRSIRWNGYEEKFDWCSSTRPVAIQGLLTLDIRVAIGNL
jgi:pimeloyl-ACP methyl ester carboxylesterase